VARGSRVDKLCLKNVSTIADVGGGGHRRIAPRILDLQNPKDDSAPNQFFNQIMVMGRQLMACIVGISHVFHSLIVIYVRVCSSSSLFNDAFSATRTI
jgi:hypothetical protein